MNRHELSSETSNHIFSTNARRTHPLNLRAVPMRGGFRI